jgi:hypothetical protein
VQAFLVAADSPFSSITTIGSGGYQDAQILDEPFSTRLQIVFRELFNAIYWRNIEVPKYLLTHSQWSIYDALDASPKWNRFEPTPGTTFLTTCNYALPVIS